MVMTQEEKWKSKYNEVLGFIKNKQRNPSKYYPEERNMHSWVHHTRKLMNKGELKAERVLLFKNLLELCEQYRHKNQYE